MAGRARVLRKTTHRVVALFANASDSQECILWFSAFCLLPHVFNPIATRKNHKKLARRPPPVPESAEPQRLC